MKKNFLKTVVFCLILSLVLVAVGCGGTQEPAEDTGTDGTDGTVTEKPTYDVSLDFVSAPTDGDWYVISAAMWDLWQDNIDGIKMNILPGGGNGNIEAVATDQAQLGMASSTDVVGASLGVIPFSEDNKFPNLRMLFSLAPNAQYTIAYKDSGILTLDDLRDKRVNVKPKGYSSQALNMIVLEAAGLAESDFASIEYVGDGEAVELMQDGHLDAMMSGGNLPDATFLEVSTARPIQIVAYGQEIIDAVQQLNPGLFQLTIPEGIYNGVDEDIEALGYTLTVFVNEDVPEDLIYDMTKVICENIDILRQSVAAFESVEPQDFAKDLGIPYHPGAVKYYTEQGWM